VHPDELMILWGDLPAGTQAHLFLNRRDAAGAISLAVGRRGLAGLSEQAPGSLTLNVGALSWVPVPASTRSVPALLTLKLPEGVRSGQRFRVIVHQVSGLTRAIVGSFELAIPVLHARDLLSAEEDRLAVLRCIARSIPENDPWQNVFNRYIKQTAGRVRGFGGRPDAIPPSLDGAPRRQIGCLGWSLAILGLLLVLLRWIKRLPSLNADLNAEPTKQKPAADPGRGGWCR